MSKGNLDAFKTNNSTVEIDAVKNRTPSPIPSSQIVINQAIIDGINKSANLKKEIEITIPEI